MQKVGFKNLNSTMDKSKMLQPFTLPTVFKNPLGQITEKTAFTTAI